MASTGRAGFESENGQSVPGCDSLATSARQVLIMQGSLMLVLAAAVLCYGVWQRPAESQPPGMIPEVLADVMASCFGVLLGMAATILSRRSVSRSATAALKTPQYAMLPIYTGLLNKLVIVGGGLAFGLIVLGLEPLFVVAGYLVSQLALVVAMIRPAAKTRGRKA